MNSLGAHAFISDLLVLVYLFKRGTGPSLDHLSVFLNCSVPIVQTDPQSIP